MPAKRFYLLFSLVFSAFAQDITGTWQGMMQIPQSNRELRTLIKISKDGSNLKGMFYDIEQAGQSAAVSSITIIALTVKMVVPALGGTYEGKLDSDDVNLTGAFLRGTALTLNLKHVSEAQAWPIPEPPASLKPMATDADPAFEVATIKPSRPESVGKGFRLGGRQFSTFNTSVVDLISYAYDVQATQITNGPSWIESEKYDLAAKADGQGTPNEWQWKIMIRKLLADRFKLAFHHDKKELSVFTINVAKGGVKIARNEADAVGTSGVSFRGLGDLVARNAALSDLAGILQSIVLDRPVIDQTALQGRFDFTLKWTPDESQFASIGPVPPQRERPDAPPDLFTAIQQQTGLKLEVVRIPADVIVIDRVEKHSEN